MDYDALIVGSGPNGLAAAAVLAGAGRSVLVVEAADTPGGGLRSAELTAPGFVHDLASAIHPLAVASPFLSSIPLREHGLEWVEPPAPLAHPLDDGRAAVLHRSVVDTAAGLGSDGPAYRRLMDPLVERWDLVADQLLGPVLRLPRHPLALARFAGSVLPAATLIRRFATTPGRALVAGNAAHGVLPLNRPLTASFALVLGTLGHRVGWPFPNGGAQRLAEALVSYVTSLGAEIRTGVEIERLEDLPKHRAVLFDVGPRALAAIAGPRLGDRYRRRAGSYRYGPGAYKVDYALDGPVPWAAEEVAQAGTIHVGGTFEEIAASAAEVASGRHPEHPFLLVAQHSRFDPTRAPAGHHTLWVYTHVPNGSSFDMSERIETQLERFAPGFRDRIVARHVTTPADLEAGNSNLVGGDFSAGSHRGLQLLLRPVGLRRSPYATPAPEIFLCSASTPPGGGVHGMCGFHAAEAALSGVLR